MRKKPKKQELTKIPGIGKSIANDLNEIGIFSVTDLKGQNPELLYDKLNNVKKTIQDKCVLYVFRCAAYYAETDKNSRENELLKWWNWKDSKISD